MVVIHQGDAWEKLFLELLEEESKAAEAKGLKVDRLVSTKAFVVIIDILENYVLRACRSLNKLHGKCPKVDPNAGFRSDPLLMNLEATLVGTSLG